MPRKRRTFKRSCGKRRYRKLFIVAVEGQKTELQCFMMLNNQNSIIRVMCLTDKHQSSPPQVLQRMKDYLDQESLKDSDEAWLIVDKDEWTERQLALLHRWSQSRANYGFALSNPKFEYWLLLHFEDGLDVGSARDCDERLINYLPGYNKNIDSRNFTLDHIKAAIRRAKIRDNPPCSGWPRNMGTTTVYKLVEKIIET